MQFLQKNDNPASPNASPENLPIEALAKLVLLGEEHSGRDEMNLAGNPFALLQPSQKSSQNVLFREFDRTLPDGRTVKARWEVAGHPQLGLPGPSEEVLLLVLMQLTREAGEENGSASWPRTVHFSRYDLLSRMGWTNNAKCYRSLTEGFQRLTNVTINARYAFFDAASKLPIADANFHLLESSDIVDEPAGRKGESQLPLSSFTWSERMHESFVAGNVRSLSLEFVLRLELPLSRRLFRFLDAMRWAQKPARREFSIGLLNLRDRLGMTPYPYASKVKEKLAGAHEELRACGYLADIEFRKAKGKSGESLVCYTFGSGTAALSKAARVESKNTGKTPASYSRVETMVEYDLEDEHTRDAACDAVFAALETPQREAIDEGIWKQMPSFLRNNRSLDGARSTLARNRRLRVMSDYGDRVRAILEEAARAEAGTELFEATQA